VEGSHLWTASRPLLSGVLCAGWIASVPTCAASFHRARASLIPVSRPSSPDVPHRRKLRRFRANNLLVSPVLVSLASQTLAGPRLPAIALERLSIQNLARGHLDNCRVFIASGPTCPALRASLIPSRGSVFLSRGIVFPSRARVFPSRASAFPVENPKYARPSSTSHVCRPVRGRTRASFHDKVPCMHARSLWTVSLLKNYCCARSPRLKWRWTP